MIVINNRDCLTTCLWKLCIYCPVFAICKKAFIYGSFLYERNIYKSESGRYKKNLNTLYFYTAFDSSGKKRLREDIVKYLMLKKSWHQQEIWKARRYSCIREQNMFTPTSPSPWFIYECISKVIVTRILNFFSSFLSMLESVEGIGLFLQEDDADQVLTFF